MTVLSTRLLSQTTAAMLLAAAVSLSACEPKPDAPGVAITPPETTQPETPVVTVPELSTEITAPTYRGRIEFFDEEGRPVYPMDMPNPVLDILRAAKTNPQVGVSINKTIADTLTAAGHAVPAVTMTYSEIAGLSEKYTNLNEAPALHSGLVTVRYGDTIFGVTSTLTYNEAREGFDIKVEPWGFEASNLEIVSNRNVREDPNDMPQTAPLIGEWVGNVYQVKDLREKDGAYQYALIKATHAASGKTFTFYGPDNFQTYR